MKTPVNARTLREHFTYSWWKYLIIVALVILLVDVVFSMTAYRVPPEKKIEFIVYGQMDQSGALEQYLESVREKELPEMEETTCEMILDEEQYGPTKLMTYFAVGNGDVFLLPREEFLSNAAQGSLVPLENDEELMALFNQAGMNLQTGWRRNTETGENHLYGIPQSKLPGLSRYAYANDGYLCIVINNGNEENVLRFFRILCRDMIIEPEPVEEPVPDASAEPAS